MAKAFVSLGPPVAAASIAQVHRGEVEHDWRTPAGRRAPAQCRLAFPPRPRRFLLRRAQCGSAFGRSAAAAADRGHQHDVALGRDGDGPAAEAAALSEMAENTRDDPDFRVPTVDWDRTTHNVLTMEWIDGIALNDHAASQRRISTCPISAAR